MTAPQPARPNPSTSSTKKTHRLPTWFFALAAVVSIMVLLVGLAGRQKQRSTEVVASVHDAGGELKLHPDGTLTAPAGFTAEQLTVLAAVLQDRRLPAPAAPAASAALQEKAAATQKVNPQAHLLLAALYRKAGQTEAAKQQLEQLMRQNPDSALVRELEKSLQ